MEYKPDFAELKPYYQAFWNCAVLDRIAVSVTAPRKPDTQPELNWREPRVVAEEPIDCVLDAFESVCQNTFYGGLAVPFFLPNFGPDVFSGFLGVPLNYSDDSRSTSWADWSKKPFLDYEDLSLLALNDANPLYRKVMDFTRQALDRGRDRYLVGCTDLHGGFDSLAVLRGGPDKAALDLVENPAGVKKAMVKLYQVWQRIYDDYYSLVKDCQPGTITWISTWAPGRMYPVQNDFSCLVSSRMYREFFLEELLMEIDYLDYSIYHLDGEQALQHLDILLDIPKLNAIQWVAGARYQQDSIARWFPLYQKIQARKKSIILYPKIEEIDLVLENLKPEGLWFSLVAETEEQARQILAKLGW